MPRLPIDTILLVIGVPGEGDHAAALLSAWRGARMPVVHIHVRDEVEAALPQEESVILTSGKPAFADTRLESLLDARGATTLVICGVTAGDPIEQTARDAVGRGYRVFVADDAGGVSDVHDLTLAATAALVQAATLARAIRDRYGR